MAEVTDEQLHKVLEIVQEIGAQRGTNAEAYTLVKNPWQWAIEGPFAPLDWVPVNDRLNDDEIPVHVHALAFGMLGIGSDEV